MKVSHYTNLLDLPGEGDELLEWGEPVSQDTPNFCMPTDPHKMLDEVNKLKKVGRDPITTEFKPLRQNEPASSDFFYHYGFWSKSPDECGVILCRISLAHMRAGAHYIYLGDGRKGFVTEATSDGRLVKLQISFKGSTEYVTWDSDRQKVI